jgi:uncharacterized protein YkwD
MRNTIKLVSFGVLAILLLGAAHSIIGGGDATIDKAEEQKAFELLNKVRQNPKAYSAGWNNINLSSVKAKPALVWNDTLAKVAEAKAIDMARRNYFNHIDPGGYGMNYYINKAGYKLSKDWLKNKNENYFESIAAGENTGEETIRDLIIDKDTPGLGHRSHLLGMNKFYADLVDIGIGFARCSNGCTYQTYVSVVIARHH